ncbi:MAG: rhomboid family intramembrane serine protease [Planctomycetaceae bacterium]
MGFQDRGYYADYRTRGGPVEWTGVNSIIAINVGVWLANFILSGNLFEGLLPPISLHEIFCLPEDLPRHPWSCYTLLTYGFLHDPTSPWHVIFNMLTLWFFGREVEAVLGRAEFVRFYIASIIFAGLGWVVVERFSHPMAVGAPLIGASGGVMAVLAAFIWYFPRQTILFYGVFPVPAWALGLLYIGSDIGGLGDHTSQVAHVAHLCGAVFGLLYTWRGWNFEGLASGPANLLASRRSMRVFRPDDDAAAPIRPGDDPVLDGEVDRILEKISRRGEASLSAEERETLTSASRRLKGRRG